MLNKIENITLNPNSRNEIKSSKKDSHINHLTKKENFSDTITFSAALLFLSQLKWRLKKINHISTDELEVEIIANDISYSTIINLKEPSVKNLNFKVQNEFPFKHNKSLYSIDVLFNYVKVESTDEEKLYEPVNKLLYRIPSYEYADEKEISSTFYYELLEGIETGLAISLSMIYRNMIQFSDKLAGKNNLSVIENLNTDEQLIKINKIVVNHIQ
ncbi:hypothetical protein [Ignavibacterium sp.]|uniref:hypothetical protein n=1 Tax=Ignavibacterium sp. TaxID=2651167 RepID=UPI0021FB7877|nr:hypothetical protein [Ignavibacterium sp.]BDQ02817.1 MAG: hypothetical protein KatS3mg037_1392 [Ignavibacterium sp.]